MGGDGTGADGVPADGTVDPARAVDGPRRVTVAQVARDAGVSPMTVSYAYNQPERVAAATRARVLAAADRLGWTGPNPAARSLRRGRFGSLGVVLSEPLTYAFEDLQATRFLAGVASVCVEEGLGISLLAADGGGAELLQGAAVDAFVLWTRPDGDPGVEAVVRSGTPAGVLGGPLTPGLRLVSIDDRAAARVVAGEAFAGSWAPLVLSLPFDAARRPAVLTGPDPAAAASAVTRNRLAGARDRCLSDRHLPGWDRVRVAVLSRNSRAEAQRTVAELLRGDDPPDAVMAMSDELALGSLAAARELGVMVPDEMAITGWDGSAEADAAGLTTVEQSLHDQGRALTLAVLDPSVTIAEPPWALVRRSSTRPPGSGQDVDRGRSTP